MEDKKFLWDGAEDRETLIFRRLKYDDPIEVLKDYSIEELKAVFFKNWHNLDKKSFNFWKLVLEIDDEEFNRKAKKDFKTSIKLWSY